MPHEFKAPLAVKFFLAIVAFMCISYNVFYAYYKANRNKNEFFKKSFSSIVVSVNSFEGRTVEFHLKNGLKLYFLPPASNKLKVGDSVIKDANTYKYNVFRKSNDSRYIHYGVYYFDKIQ